MTERVSHPIFSAIDRLFDIERERIEAKRDLAKELLHWLASRDDQAGAVEIEKTPAQQSQSASSSEPEPYLTIEQVAHILGEKVDTIYAKVGRGQIPHHKLDSGRKSDLRFRYSEIVEWSKANADRIQEQKRSPKRKLRAVS